MSVDMLINPVSFPGWLLLSISTLFVLSLYVELSGRKQWAERGISGFDTLGRKVLAIAGSLILGLSGFWLLGLTFGYAVTLISYALILSTFTDISSHKAPREIAMFAGLGSVTIVAADYFALQIDPDSYPGIMYLAVTLGTLVIMMLALRLFSPNGLGMADVRILFTVGWLSYWLGAIYILMTVLIASAAQALIRLGMKVSRNSSAKIDLKSKAPFIPALSAGAVLAILPSIFLAV